MPDLEADASGRLRRSRRRFVTIASVAAAGFVFGAGAFTYSLVVNYDLTHQAISDARAAAADAERAAAHAEQAHLQADAAARRADLALAASGDTRTDLCHLLAITARHGVDESPSAGALYVDFHCLPQLPRGKR